MNRPDNSGSTDNNRSTADPSHSATIWKIGPNQSPHPQTDQLAVEEPLQIEIDGQPWLTTMRTPGHDQELALGLLLAEGIIESTGDIADLSYCKEDPDDNLLRIILAAHCQFDAGVHHHTGYANSSCGICGKTNIDTLQSIFSPISDEIKINAEVITRLPAQLEALQTTFQRTGGLHGAALFNLNGTLQVIREDVGRHNAVDKVIGWALLQNQSSLRESILLVSGRVAFEIVHKALAGGIPLITAISAPTSLAVSFASQNNQTLIGFLRGKEMNVYCGLERLEDAS
ncbi:MAG: formate dehydrogenase accessory sulfurtransferase FdhD [Gammaproteobacteria bacterium]|nr:MAG: formate dehydrogenase accessory sulfurtransferase FdhD [Gammaproteobacteria bacterium]